MSATNKKPVVLLTNDDGFDSPLLLAWARRISEWFTPVIAAPVHEMSWASARHVVTREVRVTRSRLSGILSHRITGSPVDCVHIALQHLKLRPVLVISGPNFGLNTGAMRIIFSGTVQAALAAVRLGVPSVALSIYYPRAVRKAYPKVGDLPPSLYRAELETAARILHQLWRRGCLSRGCLNINLPYPSPDPRRARVAPVHYDRNLRIFQGAGALRFRSLPAYPDFEGVPANTDMGLMRRGLIAVTPLAVSFDDRRRRPGLQRVLKAPRTSAPAL